MAIFKYMFLSGSNVLGIKYGGEGELLTVLGDIKGRISYIHSIHKCMARLFDIVLYVAGRQKINAKSCAEYTLLYRFL